MPQQLCRMIVALWISIGAVGCATQKQSYTARTGVEQLLISSAIDQSLAKIDLQPLQNRRVFLDTKYLDCVDKNYVIVAMHHRLLALKAQLVDKSDEAETIVEVASGAVGTDSEELFVGVPEIPLPPPSPIAIPRLSVFTRSKMNGTAKLLVVAYDAKTKRPVINSGSALARSDQKTWNLLGTGTVQTGSVPTELAAATGEIDFNIGTVASASRNAIFQTGDSASPSNPPSTGSPAPTADIRPVVQPKPAAQQVSMQTTHAGTGWEKLTPVSSPPAPSSDRK